MYSFYRNLSSLHQFRETFNNIGCQACIKRFLQFKKIDFNPDFTPINILKPKPNMNLKTTVIANNANQNTHSVSSEFNKNNQIISSQKLTQIIDPLEVQLQLHCQNNQPEKAVATLTKLIYQNIPIVNDVLTPILAVYYHTNELRQHEKAKELFFDILMNHSYLIKTNSVYLLCDLYFIQNDFDGIRKMIISLHKLHFDVTPFIALVVEFCFKQSGPSVADSFLCQLEHEKIFANSATYFTLMTKYIDNDALIAVESVLSRLQAHGLLDYEQYKQLLMCYCRLEMKREAAILYLKMLSLLESTHDDLTLMASMIPIYIQQQNHIQSQELLFTLIRHDTGINGRLFYDQMVLLFRLNEVDKIYDLLSVLDTTKYVSKYFFIAHYNRLFDHHLQNLKNDDMPRVHTLFQRMLANDIPMLPETYRKYLNRLQPTSSDELRPLYAIYREEENVRDNDIVPVYFEFMTHFCRLNDSDTVMEILARVLQRRLILANDFFNFIIKMHFNNQKYDQCGAVISEMITYGLQIDIIGCKMLHLIAKNVPYSGTVEGFIELAMKHEIEVTIDLYNVLIGAYISEQRSDEAHNLFNMMDAENLGVVPNNETYLLMLEHYVRNEKEDKVVSFLPIMFSNYANNGDELWKFVTKKNLRTFSSATIIFDYVMQHSIFTVTQLQNLLHFENNPHRCVVILQKLLSLGGTPNNKAYEKIIDLFCADNLPFDAENVLKIAHSHNCLHVNQVRSVAIGYIWNNQPQSAVRCISGVPSMYRCSVSGIYREVIQKFAHIGAAKQIESLMNDMLTINVQVDSHCYSSLIMAFIKCDRLPLAQQVLMTMVDEEGIGLSPVATLELCNTLLEAYAAAGLATEADLLLQTLVHDQRFVTPTAKSFEVVIQALEKSQIVPPVDIARRTRIWRDIATNLGLKLVITVN